MNIIKAEHLNKYYGKNHVLNDISFSVGKGDLLGVIGHNGCGKTTLFRILSTLTKPNNGKLEINGWDAVSQMSHLRGKIGYMPSRFSLYKDLTVEENLKFYAALFNTTIKEGQKYIENLFLPLRPFQDIKVDALSGGMKQRLVLACVLIHDPDILFLDEPTTGVDYAARQYFWQTINSLHKRRKTIIVSTHYIDEIKQCDKVMYMNNGSITSIDTPTMITKLFADDMTMKHITDNDNDVKENIIEVRNLFKEYGNIKAVNHVSFDVKKGEIFGFVGANGAGKTTLIRMLCGICHPTSGQCLINGIDIHKNYNKIKKRIGYMNQNFSLYDNLKVWENIKLFGGIYGMKNSEIRQKTEELFDKLQFNKYKNAYVKTLSLGWKQKLAFSVSIFHNPSVVFLDEPTSGVDPLVRKKFWELLYEEANKGVTIFVSTHYMDEAEYCDRVAVMANGMIKELGNPQVLKKQYGCDNFGYILSQINNTSIK